MADAGMGGFRPCRFAWWGMMEPLQQKGSWVGMRRMRRDWNVAMSDLVLQMQEDSKCKKCYASMTTNKEPVLQIGNIVNRTEYRVPQDLESAREHLQALNNMMDQELEALQDDEW